MNDQLKEKIEREATSYSTANNGFFGESMKITDYQKHKIFKDGANWLWDEGYRFTREDIIDFLEFYKFEFFKVDRLLSQEDQISQELKKGSEIEPIAVDLWIKERSKSK